MDFGIRNFRNKTYYSSAIIGTKRNSKAMSLGEALITLGIVGLVAAITIPILTVVVPNKNETLIKKGNYVLEHTLSDIINNEDYYPIKKILKEGSETEFLSIYGLRNTDKAPGTNCQGATKFCCLMARSIKLHPDSPVNCTENAAYNFKAADGIQWKIPISDFSTNDNQELRFRTLDRKGGDCSKDSGCTNPNIIKYEITPEGKYYSVD